MQDRRSRENSKRKTIMMLPMWTWATIAILSIIMIAIVKKVKRWKKLAPCPRGLPIIGHLHLIGKNPHLDLYLLAKKHGPIMHLKFGFSDSIIVSSAVVAEQILKTHDLVFAGRPSKEAMKYLTYEHRNLSFAQYGPYWRSMRKLCILELLSSHRINSFSSMRREELGLLVKSLKQAALDRATVDLSAAVSSLTGDMSCLMIFGKKYSDDEFDERGFKAVIQEAMKLAASPNLADFFPFLSRFDVQGIIKKCKAISKAFDQLLEKIIKEHEIAREGQTNDLTSILLALMTSADTGFAFDRRHVKAIMLDMLVASMDTSGTVVEWALSELLKHPHVMNKVRNELEEKVGMSREAEESDLDKLKYLEMVVKEVLRLHPVAPLLLPHEALEDCIVDGFHIPKKSGIIINAWAIGRDPNAWSDPEKFIPERFLGKNIDVRGQNFELIPFGSGRRGCAGMQLGLTVVKLLVAQLVHCFDWELPGHMLPSELDMTEEFGLVMSRAIHLTAIPTYRLHYKNDPAIDEEKLTILSLVANGSTSTHSMNVSAFTY